MKLKIGIYRQTSREERETNSKSLFSNRSVLLPPYLVGLKQAVSAWMSSENLIKRARSFFQRNEAQFRPSTKTDHCFSKFHRASFMTETRLFCFKIYFDYLFIQSG